MGACGLGRMGTDGAERRGWGSNQLPAGAPGESAGNRSHSHRGCQVSPETSLALVVGRTRCLALVVGRTRCQAE